MAERTIIVTGADATTVRYQTDATTVVTTDATGPQGPQGAPGTGIEALTTKGDLLGFSTEGARIPVGANGTVLVADSTQALGVKWDSGAQGPQGAQGAQGPQGANGSNGAAGAQGAQGAQGPQGSAAAAMASPVAPSSSWLGAARFSTPGVSHGTGQCHFVPYFFDRAVTITKIAIQVDTGAASATCSLGLYTHDTTTGLPSTLIYDAGSVSCTSSGYKIITLSSSQTVGPGIVWAACLTLTSVITVWGCGANSTGAMGGATSYHSAVSGSSPGFVGRWPVQSSLSSLPASASVSSWASDPILTFVGLQ